MKIEILKKHYPLVYKKAMDNYKEHGYWHTIEINSFVWELTEEGYSFWECILNQWFDKAEKICPHLF